MAREPQVQSLVYFKGEPSQGCIMGPVNKHGVKKIQLSSVLLLILFIKNQHYKVVKTQTMTA